MTVSTWPTRGRWYRRLIWALWALLLLSVPVTSAPQVAALLGDNTVSPLALVPLAGIVVLWFIPYVARGGRLPAISWPLLAFISLAVLSALAATFLRIYPLKGQEVISRELRALATIAVSLGFYWSAAILPRSDEELTGSLRALYLGGALMLAWSTVQAWVFFSGRLRVPLWITNAHHLLSIRDPLRDRVTGLAFEPSWLGDQLVVLYLPLWLSSVLSRVAAFSKSKGILSVELVLFLWGTWILYLTKSRISLLSLFLVGLVLYAVGTWRASGWVVGRVAERLRRFKADHWRLVVRLVLEAAALCGIAVATIGGLLVAGRVDPRMRRLSTLPDLLAEIRHYYPNEVAFEVANRLAFAERVVYWADGFRVFEQYPLLGVGPGNAGFFFERSLPGYGYQLTEITQILRSPDSAFPNPKNLWVRLLGETGLAGFAAFLVWLVLLAAASWQLWKQGTRIQRLIGLAGLLALLAQVGEGFSLDSFALPQLWLILGLVTAAAWRRM